MKKMLIAVLLVSATTMQADDVMTKTADGTYIINTTTLASDVEGYAGTTPMEVHIKKNKIVKVVALKSQETPNHRQAPENLFCHLGFLCRDFVTAS